MTPEMRNTLSPFLDKAIAQGIPADEVERWLDTARPCATLSQGGDGPAVGMFGGPLMLPADTPTPVFPFVASVDLAALPAGATDLPLPPDGHLLLFAFPDDDGDLINIGEVVYVPAGAATEERDRNSGFWSEVDEFREMVEAFPQGRLRATTTPSLPSHHAVQIPGSSRTAPLPGHPRSRELAELWEQTRGDIATEGPLQIGGYASEEAVHLDPVSSVVECAVRTAESRGWGGAVSGAVEDWVLLADWSPRIEGMEGAVVHWAIQREDLTARRFDRTVATVFWNP
ncbi:DUF1963 domain-containing protein [Streptomyces sp. SID12501]|uniref:DUF1963 domain-containing protein n=1 Tax=Streptomyces sp. SID12501 TaxID=2706042 RepID=A0A6B3BXH0_9ACTN|nr:DUF1963 domain-containing protein [Streptomyces sp. SID12501]NEC88954.1 DUF1963 domain-containing protein [Streptomyces sp. SID12501]